MSTLVGALFNTTAITMLLACALPQAPAAADTITLSPRVVPVGKWAEGVAYGGGTMWVAESGQQSIVQLNIDGSVARRITVGRLPVQVTFANDGNIYTLVQTDKLLWQQNPRQVQGRAITGLEGCPNSLADGGRYLWVLTWPDCSSDRGRVIRIDPQTGSRASSGILAQNAGSLIAENGRVWITHDRGQALSIVDEQSLAIRKADVAGVSLQAITASAGKIFVGGSPGFNDPRGMVVSLDPSTAQELRRQVLDQRVAVMASDEKSVVAIGDKGKIFILAPDTLELLRTVTVTGRVDPKFALILGDDLYLTSGQHQAENGAMLILSAWRPAPRPAAPASPPAPAAPTVVVSPAAPVSPPAPAAPPAAAATGDRCPYHIVNASAGVVWLYNDPDTDAPKVVAVAPDANGLVADRCIRDWCHVSYRGANGWAERRNLQAVCN